MCRVLVREGLCKIHIETKIQKRHSDHPKPALLAQGKNQNDVFDDISAIFASAAGFAFDIAHWMST